MIALRKRRLHWVPWFTVLVAAVVIVVTIIVVVQLLPKPQPITNVQLPTLIHQLPIQRVQHG